MEWIKLHRSLLDWEWYQDHNTTRLFIHCLLTANETARKRGRIQLKPGQFLTSLNQLSNETGLTKKQVRTALAHLIESKYVAHEGTNRYSIISICNIDIYSIELNFNGQGTGHAKGTEKMKLSRPKREVFNPPSVEQVRMYCREKSYRIKPETFVDYYNSNGWLIGNNKMRDWKAAVNNWERRLRKENPSGDDGIPMA